MEKGVGDLGKAYNALLTITDPHCWMCFDKVSKEDAIQFLSCKIAAAKSWIEKAGVLHREQEQRWKATVEAAEKVLADAMGAKDVVLHQVLKAAGKEAQSGV